MPTYREQPCAECGNLVLRRVRGGRRVLCADCADKVVEETVRAMIDGEGPKYEAWLAGMRKAAARPARGKRRAS